MNAVKVLKLGEPTKQTGLVYSKAVVLDAIEKGGWSDVVLLGLSASTLNALTDLSRASHVIERLYVSDDDDWLVADLTPLNTDAGRLAQMVGESLSIRPVGVGFAGKDKKVTGYSISGLWADASNDLWDVAQI